MSWISSVMKWMVVVVGVMGGVVMGEGEAVPKEAAKKLPPLRVGVTLSEYTATGPSWIGSPYGFGRAKLVIESLQQDLSLEIVPVVEPTFIKGDETSKLLEDLLPKAQVVTATDVEALKKLDVLVITNYSNIEDDVAAAFEAAVKDGLNMMVASLGIVTPGYTKQICRLVGLEEAEYGWNPQTVDCVVAAEHPLLGKLKKGDKILMQPNGAYGKLVVKEGRKGGSLIDVVDTQTDIYVPRRKKIPADVTFSPLYISELGKGKILGVCWSPYTKVPADVQDKLDEDFYVRAVKWLGGRLEEKPEAK